VTWEFSFFLVTIAVKNPRKNLAANTIWSRNGTTSSRKHGHDMCIDPRWCMSVRMVQFALKKSKLLYILSGRGSQDLRSPSPMKWLLILWFKSFTMICGHGWLWVLVTYWPGALVDNTINYYQWILQIRFYLSSLTQQYSCFYFNLFSFICLLQFSSKLSHLSTAR